MTQKEMETAIQDLTNRVRWLEMNQHQSLPRFPETYEYSPDCFKQVPSTQACPPIDFEKKAEYNEQQVKECLTPFS